MGGLEGLQFLEQAVVLGVRDLRRVQHVVAVGVVLQQRAQLGGAFFGGGCRCGAIGAAASPPSVS
jgi:hypothetical protein